uniref:non-specific serine/threonine protein kinase n=1 Tax=Angiostrongylus cantonensis TaxID=6313 RepID=A0A158P7F7_ANGCA
LMPGGKDDIRGDFEAPPKTTSQYALFPTLYVGESTFGLFAMDVLVDKHTITYAPKYLGPPLLEGPSPIALSDIEKSRFIPPSRPVITIDVPAITHKTTDGEFLLLGYHEKPAVDLGAIIPMRFTNSPSFPHIDYKQEQGYIEEVPDGWMSVGKLLYNPSEILGRGCEGTVVYRGKFDGRDVAVKRVISEFVKLVDREADLLRESDTHPHESDSQFRYLALELCLASLNDYVHEETVREKISVVPTELLRQAAEGLAHLHVMQIVHRDMKPQNVLLSTAGSRGVRAVISDFGLCKRVQPGRHSLSRRSGLAGTDGWIAPEMLTLESTSFPVDIFSLGCIFFYVLSDGNHPFGDSLHRQTNIVNGQYAFSGIKKGIFLFFPSSAIIHNEIKVFFSRADVPVATALIERMIQRVPDTRPSIHCVLAHPFFWDGERRLQFFGDVSDRIEKEEDSSTIVRRLESNARTVLGGNWRNSICDPLATDLRKFRTYKGHSVRDLLRAMRNKRHHYRELPENVQDSLGRIPDQFVLYFTTRFPLLLLHTYEAVEWCADEDVFKGYYPDEVPFTLFFFLIRNLHPSYTRIS